MNALFQRLDRAPHFNVGRILESVMTTKQRLLKRMLHAGHHPELIAARSGVARSYTAAGAY